MATKTTTGVTHYHVQKKRRADFLEEWRKYRNTVVRVGDVEMHDTARGMRRGVYVGADADRPTRSMDALVHEIDPGRSGELASATESQGTRIMTGSAPS